MRVMLKYQIIVEDCKLATAVNLGSATLAKLSRTQICSAVSSVMECRKVNSHYTRHDPSRYIAMRHVAPYAFLSLHTGKALPDIFSYNGVTTTRHASRSRLTNSVNSLNCIAKANKKRRF